MRIPLFIRRGTVLAYCALIFYLSSRSEFPDVKPWYPAWLPDPNLIAHFCLYAGLGFIAWLDFRAERAEWLRSRAAGAAVIFSALYGVSDEIHQLFTPNRAFQMEDLLMDTLGPLAAMAAVAVRLRIKKRKSRNT